MGEAGISVDSSVDSGLSSSQQAGAESGGEETKNGGVGNEPEDTENTVGVEDIGGAPDLLLSRGVTKYEVSRVKYRLYAVVIHSGTTSNSGHYFSFARSSDCPASEVDLDDSPHAPWIKFNDMRVEPINFAGKMLRC